MNAHIKKVYVPMTETGFYILLCLGEENHGYGIIQRVERLTGGEIRLSPGTMYGSLSKMEKDGLIAFVREEDKRKLYRLTDLGRQVLELPVDALAPNPNQPRKHFSQEELNELADSISQLGVMQPLTVRRRDRGWELIAGERRWRAAQLAGLSLCHAWKYPPQMKPLPLWP